MRPIIFSLTVAAGLLVGMLSPNLACSDVDAAFDCQQICDRYQECFDNNFNVGTCRSNCRTKAENDADYKRKADICETCIDGASCAGAAFSCGLDCAGIVP